MTPVEGFAMASWERGYGDFVMRPDLDTLRPVPWQEATALCLADVVWHDGSDVVASPRQVLRRQLARLAERGWTALRRHRARVHRLPRQLRAGPRTRATASSSRPTSTTSTTRCSGTARVEPLIRRIRNGMLGAGMAVEDSKGECNLGQHEINFHYADALRTADEHVIYKNGAKEIAAEMGMAITFMAKFNEREGNSCHIHFSLADARRPAVRPRPRRRSTPSSPASSPACAS